MRLSLFGLIILISIWYIISLFVAKIFLPTPISVFSELHHLLSSQEIYFDIYSTLKRTLLGLLLGSTVGIFFGLIIGYYEKVYKIFQLPIDFIRSIPVTALFPLFIVFFGLGDNIKIFAAAWISGFVFLINTIYGVKNLSTTKMMLAKLKKLSFIKLSTLIILPGALPHIIAGLRVGFSLALIIQVVAEMFLGSNVGLGSRIYNASTIFEMEEVYASILLIGFIGYMLNKGIILLENKVVHWSGRV
jgi:ABC-type nitrate/sulfonate/bicarbonate transport system permease component